MNPIFAADDDDNKRSKKDAGYVIPNRHGRKIQPIHDDITPEEAHPAHRAAQHHTEAVAHHTPAHTGEGSNPAVELIRRKLEALYDTEPNAKEEAQEAKHEAPAARSKHQQFMYDLSTSGKSLAEIQTAWHEYYVHLTDAEKHEVWQEFYANNGRQPSVAAHMVQSRHPQTVSARVFAPAPGTTAGAQIAAPAFPGVTSQQLAAPATPERSGMLVVAEHLPSEQPSPKKEHRSVQAIKQHIKKRVNMSAAAQKKAKQHAHSLLFGLSSGAIVLVVVLFGLFNEMVIAPFIQPSRHAAATPIILNTDGIAPTNEPQVIVPKISAQLPVDYNQTSSNEKIFQSALENGVVHYPTTAMPGQKGNTAIFGHSSNNIFNPGKYKFAFVLLHELVPGDIFYLTYNGKVYSYKVFQKQIVAPSNVSVLNPVEGKTAVATLITCDPPGTSLNRLVVWGEQISPDPNANTEAAPVAPDSEKPDTITSNGPTLWKRLTGWITGD